MLVDHVFTNFPYLTVNIGTEATKRPWRENVARCRETWSCSCSSRSWRNTDAFDERSQRDEFRDAMTQIFSYLLVGKRYEVASEWRIQAETWLTTRRSKRDDRSRVATLTLTLNLMVDFRQTEEQELCSPTQDRTTGANMSVV